MTRKEELLRNIDIIRTINAVEDAKKKAGILSEEHCEKLVKYYEFLDKELIEEFKDFIDWGSVVRRFSKDIVMMMAISEILFSSDPEKMSESGQYKKGRHLWLILIKDIKQSAPEDVIQSVLKTCDSDEMLTLFGGANRLANFNSYMNDFERYRIHRYDGKKEINFDTLSRIENLSIDYIDKYIDEFNWQYLSESHDLTDIFLFSYRKRLNLEIVEKRIERMED